MTAPFESRQVSLSFPLIIGHRGAAAVAPENTIVSFERAMLDGADGIEFDVRLSKDRVPVVIHDASLRRTALRAGLIASLTAEELSSVNVGAWFNRSFPSQASEEYERATIPTLRDVFELFRERDGVLCVEMKCSPEEGKALAEQVVRLIREYEVTERTVVESFTLEAITELKRIVPEIHTAALFEPRLRPPLSLMRSMLARAVECKAEYLALHHLLASRRITSEAARLGLRTVVWTADNPAWLERARQQGIYAIITNNPALFRGQRAEDRE